MKKTKEGKVLIILLTFNICLSFLFFFKDLKIKTNSILTNWQTKKIINNKIKGYLKLSQKWFTNNFNYKKGTLEYIYDPDQDEYSSTNNHIRQLATTWSMAELDGFLKDDSLSPLIKSSLDYYLKYLKEENGYSYLLINKKASLAYNAFITLTLLNFDYPEKEKLLEKFILGIISLQQKDGSFVTDFISRKTEGINFYPGEAMLALVKYYEYKQDESILKNLNQAFLYYRNYWRKNKNLAFIPWHSQADQLLYKYTKNLEIVDFVFEMNDWLVENYQIVENYELGKIGGFSKNNKPRNSTGSYLESLNAAYKTAVLTKNEEYIEKYKKSLQLGIRFILQLYVNEQKARKFQNPDKARGGILESFESNKQRIDYTQHTVMALIRAYENSIFEK